MTSHLGDEVDKGPEDKVLPSVAGDVGSVVREAVNVVRKKARNKGGSGGEGGKTRGGLRESRREGKWTSLQEERGGHWTRTHWGDEKGEEEWEEGGGEEGKRKRRERRRREEEWTDGESGN